MSATNLAKLARAIDGAQRLVVLTHDNPDPDALASAFGLAELITAQYGCTTTVAFSGIIGRAENRAMLRELNLVAEPLSTANLEGVDGLLLVDAQPGTGNVTLPEGIPLLVVLDHHPLRFDPADVALADVRDTYGATATLLVEYADEAGAVFSRPVATALFYALKSETQDLGREATAVDRSAYLALMERADMATVARIQRARVPREYFRAFRDAVDRAEIRAAAVITDLGPVASPDIVAEIADFLLRLQGIEWSCCLGRHQNNIALSVRTSGVDGHAGRLVRRVARGIGTAGGHGSMAGAQVPIRGDAYEQTLDEVRSRLLHELGVADVAVETLVSAQ